LFRGKCPRLRGEKDAPTIIREKKTSKLLKKGKFRVSCAPKEKGDDHKKAEKIGDGSGTTGF